MKAALLFIALGVALITSVTIVSLRQAPVTVGCTHICQQDIASATYFGLMELDCDNQWDSPPSYGGNACSDELGNVNRLPRVDGVGPFKTGLKVQMTFFLNGSGSFPFGVWFWPTGEIRGFK